MPKIKKICLLFCGGTIAMLPDKKTGALAPAASAEDLLRLVPKISEIAKVDIVELFNIDSTDMTADHWSQIAEAIYKKYDKYDGFVVTHGTDTMADTGSALALALGKNLNKPVVLTGSQSYPEAVGTDAKFNLENSFRVATSDIAEVVISFGHFVFRAIRAQKRHDSDYNAFMSPAYPELGFIRGRLQWSPFTKQISKKGKNLILKPNFESGLLNVKVGAAVNPKMIDEILGTREIKGLIFESLGAGNIPSRYLPVIKKAIKLDIPVLITSPFIGGSTTGAGIYKTGFEALEAGVIPVNDMTFISAQVKLMWCLAQIINKDKGIVSQVKAMFQNDYVGEVTVE